jgi:serine/threonine protein kinase/WD40 repeat protein/Flp pilus assembly protein TadD
LRRFHVEARSAAGLHHTNIVPVFDFGEQDGVCYYAMPFIQGQGLDKVLADVRRIRGEPGSAPCPPSKTDPQDEDQGLRSLSEGLLTGRFAVGPRASDGDLEATASITPTSGVSGPVDPVSGARVEGAPAVESGPPQSPADPSDSRSLASQGETRYYREIARLGAQIADALDYAHRQNIIHRDIKPSNLLLDTQGNAWVTDFGLAKLVEGEDLSGSQDLVGTLRFMAPERFRGVTDRRGDIYALGATLYELLALRPAFDERDQIQLIDQITHQPPAPLRQHDRRIPRDLETIVHRVVAKDPKDRCDTAGELRDELRRFLEGRPTRWRRVGPAEQFRRWCKRNPVVAGLNALAAALTIIIAIVSTVAAYRNGRLAEELKGQRDEASRNLVQAKKNLIQAHTTEAESRRQGRRVGQRFAALGAIERAMRLAPEVGITEAERFRLRNEAIAALALPDLRVAKELDVPRAKENGFAVDPGFERYAFRLDDGTVVVRRLADDSELFRLASLPPPDGHAGFSPDGRYLAMTSGGGDILQVWDLQEQRLVLTDRQRAGANPINWSIRPDGRELALGRQDGSIVFYELASGRLLRSWAQYSFHSGLLAYSPDSSKLAIRPKDGSTVQIVSCEGARRLATLPHPAVADHFVWNPRRPHLLAVACEDNVIYIWDVETGQQTATLKGETYNGIIIAYHPNGELLASRGWHGVLRLWDTRTGRMLLSQPSSWSSTLEFDRTGRWLSVDATVEKARILEIADAAECRTLVREPFREDDRHGALAIDPAGRRVVTTGPVLTVWDLLTGATLATLSVNYSHRVLFDPSGAVLTSRPFLLRWPVGEVSGGATIIGPPRMLQFEGSHGFSISREGRTIAWPRGAAGGLVFDAADPTRFHRLQPLRSCDDIALSPDGRWAVTGSFHVKEGMHLWDAQTGRLVHDFPGVPDEVGTGRAFSPDGRWLAVNWDGWVLFETTTWTPRVRLFRGASNGLAFAPDSRTAVYDDNAETLILVEVESGRELARLQDPEQARIRTTEFTPDGSHLVTILRDRHYLRVWDLRVIRRRLAELRLDLPPPAMSDTPDAPGSFPPFPKPFRVDRGQLDTWLKQAAEPPEQIVERTTRAIEGNPDDSDAHHRRGHALYRLKRYHEAIADFTAALKLCPNNAHLLASRGSAEASLNRFDEALADCEAALRQQPDPADRERLPWLCNNLAWALVSRPGPGRDPARALDLARRAVTLAPDRAFYLNTLGVAQYRTGQTAEAVDTLEKSLAAGKGESDAFDLFFLAMARYRLGRLAEARADFDRAAKWRRAHPNLPAQWSAELDAFQAEAREVLYGPLLDLPADLFAPGPQDQP